MATRYIIIANTLYHKGYHYTLSRCLDQNEASMALKEAHYGLYAAHMSGIVLAGKRLRDGYYWYTIEHVAYAFFKRCLPC